jgi:L-asparagine permease
VKKLVSEPRTHIDLGELDAEDEDKPKGN